MKANNDQIEKTCSQLDKLKQIGYVERKTAFKIFTRIFSMIKQLFDLSDYPKDSEFMIVQTKCFG